MIALSAALLVVASPLAATAATAAPDLDAALHYLATTTGASGVVNGTSLAHDGYYEAFDQFGDFGLTIDGAFALAATGSDNSTLRTVVTFLAERKKDGSARTIDDWTGIGTPYATGGAIGKEAVLAEVTGNDPRAFGGHDLIAALAQTICTTTDVPNGCGGPGNYLYSTSTFSQAFGIIAAVRAGDTGSAVGPIAYLEGLQQASGAWPSVIPDSGDSDVDSTAMAAMALALLPGDATASAAVTKGLAWIASRQSAQGGFPGVAPDSTNSSGLAIQALTLDHATYASQIAQATAFLAAQQNSDGGFDVAAGSQQGSDVRASAQVVGGVIGTSFGTLSDVVAPGPGGGGSTTTTTLTDTTTTVANPTGGESTPTTVAATATTAVVPATVGAPATLPATGIDAGRALGWVVALLVLGTGATFAGRPRRVRRR